MSHAGVWTRLLNERDARVVAEIGVFRGEFAQQILAGCPNLERYYMIDPWRHLPGWDRPLNLGDEQLERCYQDALAATDDHAARRVVLRGTTTEVIDRVADGELDFAYVDGDHTLRGIAIDLIRVWPKIRPGGLLGGDDFDTSPWRLGTRYEPTLVFPYAVYFAEAVDAPIRALRHHQFLIEKQPGFVFSDPRGRYPSLAIRGYSTQPLRGQVDRFAKRMLRKLRRLL